MTSTAWMTSSVSMGNTCTKHSSGKGSVSARFGPKSGHLLPHPEVPSVVLFLFLVPVEQKSCSHHEAHFGRLVSSCASYSSAVCFLCLFFQVPVEQKSCSYHEDDPGHLVPSCVSSSSSVFFSLFFFPRCLLNR